MPPTVAIVSLGTTPGLRVADAALAQLIEAGGPAVRVIDVRIGAAARLRRQITVTDLVESLAARRAAGGAAGADAVILSTTTAGFWVRPAVPCAIRFDTPAAVNRPGASGAVSRAAERRSFAAADLLLPYGEAGARAARAALRGAPAPPCVAVPVPIEEIAGAPERDIDALAYAGYPEKRGLDLLVAAWAAAAPPGARLVVAGVGRERAAAWLGRRGTPIPAGVEWAGLVPRADWLRLLGRARVFVNASRREDYGQSPLEALAAGAVLVTAPAAGAYEALALARTLGAPLVASDVSAESLADALRAGLALTGPARRDYAAAALKHLQPYRRDAVARTVAGEVLPRLGIAPGPAGT